MSSDRILDIADVSRQSGLPASTLRFYEEKGLIESVGRKGLRRLYERRTVDQLALVSLARNAGFSLDEIQGFFGSAGNLSVDRSSLLAKADELDKRIDELLMMRDGLRHAAACQAPNHLECPRFRKLMRLSVRQNHKGRRRQSKTA